MPPTTTSAADLVNFINQNSPFVHKACSPGSPEKATRASAMAWALIEEPWMANSAVVDHNLIPHLGALLDRKLEAINTFQGDPFLTIFDGSKQIVARLPRLMDSEIAAQRAFTHFESIASSFLESAGIRGCFDQQVLRNHIKPDYTFKLSAEPLDDEESPKVVGEIKKPLLMSQIQEDMADTAFFGGPDDNTLCQCATEMGIFETQWLFLTSYNIWSIMRLVTPPVRNSKTYLVYSPFISVGETEHDTAIFRAFLSLLLCDEAELNNIPRPDAPVPPVPSAPNLVQAPSSPEGNKSDDDGSEYQPSDDSGKTYVAGRRPNTRSQRDSAADQSVQLFLSSFKPLATQKPHVLKATSSEFRGFTSVDLQLKRFVGSGAYASVVQACIIGSDVSVALKLIERLSERDDYRFDAFDREEKMYLRLEQARDKGSRTIAPRFYGRFAGKFMQVLVLELHGKALEEWSDLGKQDKVYVFDLFLALHRLGIKHGDVRPPNVVHGIDTGFRIVDFSLSQDHDCPEKEGMRPVKRSAAMQLRCKELMSLYKQLWPDKQSARTQSQTDGKTIHT